MHVHFVGIGGIGMSGIAYVLVEMGHQVSGSDLCENSNIERLREKGVQVYVGHASKNINGADLVVVSSAVLTENPEVEEAKARKIPILQRAEMLEFLMHERFGIAIAGTHGKTTTTSMVATILEKAGKDPTVVVGGEVNGFGHNAKLGLSKYIVAEADESDASFLRLSPQVAVVTNIDADVNLSAAPFAVLDFDYDKTLKRVKEVFVEFLQRIPQDGFAILCTDCPHVRAIVPTLKCQVTTYGLQSPADLIATKIELHESNSSFVVQHKGKRLGSVTLRVPGTHNVLNALAAIGVALQLGVSFEQAASALDAFQGVKRRFQILGEEKQILVVDDYAHNPTKIKAALAAAKAGWNRRTIVVFQPHRYTRTKFLNDEFIHAFDEADVLLIAEIYSAGEPPIQGVNSQALVNSMLKKNPQKPIYLVSNETEILKKLSEVTQPKDMVLTIGAGDVYRVGNRFLESLRSENRPENCASNAHSHLEN